MWLLVVVSVVVVALLLYYVSPFHFWSLRKSNVINKIPGPPTLPLVGNALMFNMPHGGKKNVHFYPKLSINMTCESFYSLVLLYSTGCYVSVRRIKLKIIMFYAIN